MVLDRQTQLGLIRGIFGDPEEAPQLVYADWLEEQGDPVGELVRVGVELRGCLPRGRREELQRRERELLDGLGFEGRAHTAGEIAGADYRPLRGDWNFGFEDGVPLLLLTDSHGPSLPAPPPEWVERFGWFVVRLGFYDSYESRYELSGAWLRELLDSPLMERCVGLDLHSMRLPGRFEEMVAGSPAVSGLLRLNLRHSELRSEELLTLLRSPHLSGLIDLDIGENYLDPEAALALVEPHVLPGLRRLGIARLHSPAGVAVLAKSARFLQLRSLDVSRNDIDPEVARALAEGPGPASLGELDVSHDKALTDAGALALIRSRRLAGLRRLELSGTAIGTPTVEALGATDRFFRSGRLRLWGCATDDETLVAVARSPNAALLRAFVSGSAGYTDAGAKALAASGSLKGLLKLDLSRCRIGPDGAAALTDPEAFPQLEELTLRGNPIGDRGALALARWGRGRGASDLELGNVGLTAAGVAELASSGLLAGLESLDVGDNAIGDEGLAALARCPDLRGLRRLDVGGVGMTDEGAGLLAGSPHLPREMTVLSFPHHLSAQAQAALRERFGRRWG